MKRCEFFRAPAHGLLAIDINMGVVEITPMKGHTAADVEKALEDGWLRIQVADAQSVIGTAPAPLEARRHP